MKQPDYSMSLQLYPNRVSVITWFFKWSVWFGFFFFFSPSNYFKFLPLFCFL